MAYVITDACTTSCDLGCVRVCPVDAIHGEIPMRIIESLGTDERQARRLRLYIDPSTCICCGACEPECPVEAIHDEDLLPASQRGAAEVNAAFFRSPGRGS